MRGGGSGGDDQYDVYDFDGDVDGYITTCAQVVGTQEQKDHLQMKPKRNQSFQK